MARSTNKFGFLMCKTCRIIADHAFYEKENEKKCSRCDTITQIEREV
jgi:uncharacterized paraquat-inducible protein A